MAASMDARRSVRLLMSVRKALAKFFFSRKTSPKWKISSLACSLCRLDRSVPKSMPCLDTGENSVFPKSMSLRAWHEAAICFPRAGNKH